MRHQLPTREELVAREVHNFAFPSPTRVGQLSAKRWP
jgi:hypothetical protein